MVCYHQTSTLEMVDMVSNITADLIYHMMEGSELCIFCTFKFKSESFRDLFWEHQSHKEMKSSWPSNVIETLGNTIGNTIGTTPVSVLVSSTP
jgi:hypothetical protein